MRLPFRPASGLCRQCGREAIGFEGDFLCDDCKTRHPAFDRAGSALVFDGDARELINGYKFRDKLYLRNDLVDFLEGYVLSRFKLEDVQLVLPMPSSALHRWLRGYSQTKYLAEELAKRLGKRCDGRMIRRIGNPARQGTLSEKERFENVIGTFELTAHGRKVMQNLPKGAAVLVVDDIMTTGSTFSECAKMLKKDGKPIVFCASVARSLRN